MWLTQKLSFSSTGKNYVIGNLEIKKNVNVFNIISLGTNRLNESLLTSVSLKQKQHLFRLFQTGIVHLPIYIYLEQNF